MSNLLQKVANFLGLFPTKKLRKLTYKSKKSIKKQSNAGKTVYSKEKKNRYLIKKTYEVIESKKVEDLSKKSKIIKLINYDDKLRDKYIRVNDKKLVNKYIKVAENKLIANNLNKITIYYQCNNYDNKNNVYKEYEINKELRLHKLLMLINELSYEFETTTLNNKPNILEEKNIELPGYINEFRVKGNKIFVKCNF